MPLPLYKRLTYTPAVTKWLTYTLHLTEVKKLVLNLYLLLLFLKKKLFRGIYDSSIKVQGIF